MSLIDLNLLTRVRLCVACECECRFLIGGSALCALYPIQVRMERKLCVLQALRLNILKVSLCFIYYLFPAVGKEKIRQVGVNVVLSVPSGPRGEH